MDRVDLWLEVVLLMLSIGADFNAQNNQGETPLHEACLRGKQWSVLYLIKFSKIDINMQNKNGESPLHYAVRANNKEVVEVLLAMGADPMCISKSGSVIEMAAHMSSAKILGILENGGNSMLCKKKVVLPVRWDVSVTDAYVRVGTKKPFVEYKVCLIDGTKVEYFGKQYEHFAELNAKLAASFKSTQLPPLPSKSLFRRETDADLVNQRKDQLDVYLKAIVEHPRLARSTDLYYFLHPQKAEEKEKPIHRNFGLPDAGYLHIPTKFTVLERNTSFGFQTIPSTYHIPQLLESISSSLVALADVSDKIKNNSPVAGLSIVKDRLGGGSNSMECVSLNQSRQILNKLLSCKTVEAMSADVKSYFSTCKNEVDSALEWAASIEDNIHKQIIADQKREEEEAAKARELEQKRKEAAEDSWDHHS